MQVKISVDGDTVDKSLNDKAAVLYKHSKYSSNLSAQLLSFAFCINHGNNTAWFIYFKNILGNMHQGIPMLLK